MAKDNTVAIDQNSNSIQKNFSFFHMNLQALLKTNKLLEKLYTAGL